MNAPPNERFRPKPKFRVIQVGTLFYAQKRIDLFFFSIWKSFYVVYDYEVLWLTTAHSSLEDAKKSIKRYKELYKKPNKIVYEE